VGVNPALGTAQNVKDYITVPSKLLCALANIHHSMCNEMIVSVVSFMRSV